MVYDFEIPRIIDEIRTRKCRLVLLQFAEGLKTYAEEVVKQLDAASNATIVVSADPCYGGCDLADCEARRLGADLLVHFGHTPYMTEAEIDTLYVKAKSLLDPLPLLERFHTQLERAAPIGLASTIQHTHTLPSVAEWMRAHGIDARIGEPRVKATVAGQVLGCDYTSLQDHRDVKTVLFVGGGDFHALGLALSTGKRVLVLDIYRGELRDLSEPANRTLKIRWASIMLAKTAHRFGVVICGKSGQQDLTRALRIRGLLREKGKAAFLILAREITAAALMPFRADAYVITGCPRLPIDDSQDFRQPILTLQELLIAMEESREPFLYELTPPHIKPLPRHPLADIS